MAALTAELKTVRETLLAIHRQCNTVVGVVAYVMQCERHLVEMEVSGRRERVASHLTWPVLICLLACLIDRSIDRSPVSAPQRLQSSLTSKLGELCKMFSSRKIRRLLAQAR